jgi:hypothetical protein
MRDSTGRTTQARKNYRAPLPVKILSLHRERIFAFYATINLDSSFVLQRCNARHRAILHRRLWLYGLALRHHHMNRLLIGAADKTNLLLHFLEEDFSDGVTVIDPTGDVAKAAANQLPIDLTEQAVYFDPADMAYPTRIERPGES